MSEPQEAGQGERLTEGELSWIKLLVQSTEAAHMRLLAGQTPTHDELLRLVNRAEALVWHLAKRDALPYEMRAVLDRLL